MTKKIFKRSERFIQERVTPAGTHLLRIQIRQYGQTYSKSVKVSDFDTPKQAMDFAKKLRDDALAKMQAGYTVSNFPTVETLYKKSHKLFPVRKKTIIRHEYFYKYGIKQYANKTIDQITSADIQSSINDYARTHTRRQVAGLLAIWRSIYKTCAMMNINVIDRTVPVVIGECKEGKKKDNRITADDFDKFCNVLLSYNSVTAEGRYNSQCIYYALQVMKYCGLRPAECFSLTKNDIRFDTNEGSYIDVNKASHSTIDSMLEIDRTKTEKSKRHVPIPNELLPILNELLQWAKYDLLFADYHGNLQDINYVSDYVGRVSKKAKVKFNMYMLRHQFSTDLFTNGTAPNIIRDLMGHVSSSMSLDYAASNTGDRMTAVNSRKFS